MADFPFAKRNVTADVSGKTEKIIYGAAAAPVGRATVLPHRKNIAIRSMIKSHS